MNIKDLTQKFQAHIKFNADSKILKRGKAIYNKIAGVIDLDVDVKKEYAHFAVDGNRIYQVKINHFLSWKHPRSSCSCPYDWGGMCKHEVAAFLKLIDIVKKVGMAEKLNLAESRNDKRHSTQPIQISSYNPFTPDKIEHLFDLEETEKVLDYYTPSLEKESIGEIVLKSISSDWRDSNHYLTTFYFKKNDLYSICDCRQETYGFCCHQILATNYILKELGADYFMNNHPEKFNLEKEKMLKWANVSKKDFEKSFEYNFEQKKFIPKGKLTGLIFFNGDSIPDIKPFGEPEWRIPTPVLDEEIEDFFTMGYVLDCPYKATGIPSYISVIGKDSGTDFQKSIKDYKRINHQDIEKTETDIEVLNLITSIDQSNQYFDFEGGTKELFFMHKKIATLLAKTPFNYIRNRKSDDHIMRKDLEVIKYANTTAKLFFELTENKEFFILKAKLDLGNSILTISTDLNSKLLISIFHVTYQGNIYIHDDYNQVGNMISFVVENPIYKARKEDLQIFIESVVLPIAEHVPLKVGKLKSVKATRISLTPQEKRIYISDYGNLILFEPTVLYDHEKLIPIGNKTTFLEKNEDELTVFKRDMDFEAEFQAYFSTLHPEFETQSQNNAFYLNQQQLLSSEWFFDFVALIESSDIKLFGIEKLNRIKYSPYRPNITSHIKSNLDWFDVSINVSFGDEEISMSDLRKAIVKQSKYIQLKSGKLGVLPDKWLHKMETYFRLGEVKGDNIKVFKYKFSLVDHLFENISDQEVLLELAEKRRKIKQFKRIKSVRVSKNIQAELRPYQKEGLKWLQFLDEFQWGGILADDMGLGKTVQVISLLQYLVDKKRTPSLIVVPTTLLFNWKNEFQKFAPNIKYHVHYGTSRAKDLDEIKKHDVTLTTYGVILKDIKFLTEMSFEYVVLDESQAIKNVSSQRYKAVCLLNAKNRIAMTGTPIENNTFDLYAQLNFLNRGFLGSQASFKRNYSRPIDALQDTGRAKELQKMVSPFIMRRTKEQVAKDLPPKIEDYIYVELEKEQRKIYDAYKNKYRNYLLEKIDTDGMNKSKMYVLEGLTKLRLICDSPQLIKDEDYVGESAKIKELIHHIVEKTANHKMLVFSQFTKMLALVKIELDKQKIPYEYLDGKCSQKQRQQSVNNFQSNKEIRVFLISLKAGNTGLNLTAADYVYLLDPWWNPAVESQAIDRTHRIGQDKHVIAYRMIAKDTIEEKIMKLQASKKKIANDLIQTDESFMKRIKKSDIVDLFS